MSAQTAAERLREALADAEHRGDRVPCAGRDEWISEDHAERVEAVTACRPCPVSSLCAAAADEHGEKFGVWAGIDRGPKKPGKNNITARKENDHA